MGKRRPRKSGLLFCTFLIDVSYGRLLVSFVMRVEARAAQKYKAEGWSVLHRGWPDLFMYRLKNGALELKLREVKGAGDKLRPEQALILDCFHKIGIDAGVFWEAENVETDGSTAPPLPRPVVSCERLKPINNRDLSWARYSRTEDGGYLVPQGLYRKLFVRWPCVVATCTGTMLLRAKGMKCRDCFLDDNDTWERIDRVAREDQAYQKERLSEAEYRDFKHMGWTTYEYHFLMAEKEAYQDYLASFPDEGAGPELPL
jgi:VRR-NUC domain